jgi:ADP-heptose:LPS heptosyltransferase
MRRFIPMLLSALVAILVTGCAGLQYSEFKGEERAWPTSPAFATATYEVPVYRSWPEKPYIVIGHLQFKNPETDWNEGDVREAAQMAKKQGGDAIIVLPKRSDPSPTVSQSRQQMGIEGNQSAAVVLKWK